MLLVGGALLLVGGVLLQLLTLRHFARVTDHLAPRFPEQIPGWECRNEKLGPTEFIHESARELLNFDDYVYRAYTQRGRSFELYLAYWRSGRVPVQRVADHTPDICWIAAGWKREEAKAGEVLRAGKITLRPAQWRKMQFPGQLVRYVAFWHLVGGHLYIQSEHLNNFPSPLAYWREAMSGALGGQREQYFVRLSASVPFSELEADPGYQEILRALARLGLAESGSSSPAE